MLYQVYVFYCPKMPRKRRRKPVTNNQAVSNLAAEVTADSEGLFIDRISSWLASLHVENSGTRRNQKMG